MAFGTLWGWRCVTLSLPTKAQKKQAALASNCKMISVLEHPPLFYLAINNELFFRTLKPLLFEEAIKKKFCIKRMINPTCPSPQIMNIQKKLEADLVLPAASCLLTWVANLPGGMEAQCLVFKSVLQRVCRGFPTSLLCFSMLIYSHHVFTEFTLAPISPAQWSPISESFLYFYSYHYDNFLGVCADCAFPDALASSPTPPSSTSNKESI